MNNSFALDKRNAMLLGVCAGLAQTTGLDRTVVRIGTVVFAVLLPGPLGIIAYLAAAWLAGRR
jgi:phage shock protein C